MNAKRRKKIKLLSDMLSEACALLEEIKDEEEESLDNIPENLQNSEKYLKIQNTVDILDEAYDSLEEIITQIEEAAE